MFMRANASVCRNLANLDKRAVYTLGGNDEMHSQALSVAG